MTLQLFAKKLAVKFFRNEDVVGQTLSANKEPHTICGVYRSDESIISQFSSNGLDTVYLPFKSVSDYEKLPINMLYVKKQTKFINSVVDEIIGKVGKHPIPDHISNYNDINTIIGQAPKIIVFFAGILGIITLICVTVSYIKKACGYYEYNDKRSVLVYMGIAVGCIVLSIFVLKLVSFHLYLPASILHRYNIFDLNITLTLLLRQSTHITVQWFTIITGITALL